jgi:hypothetical protein
MSSLRGVEGFEALWVRRTTLTDADGTTYDLLALPDLVRAKKTQRSKDWPMLRRLLEAHYLRHRTSANPEQQRFWLLELRTPEMLVEAAQRWPKLAEEITERRPLLRWAQLRRMDALQDALSAEERLERKEDRAYWQPLRAELERLRHSMHEERGTDEATP